MSYTFTQTGAEIQALLDFVQTKMETVLFSGNTSGDVTLSESAANFSELDIYYEGYNGANPQTMTIDSPNGRTINLFLIESAGGLGTRIRQGKYTISGTAITNDAANSAQIVIGVDGTVETTRGTNVIHITKVVGRG